MCRLALLVDLLEIVQGVKVEEVAAAKAVVMAKVDVVVVVEAKVETAEHQIIK